MASCTDNTSAIQAAINAAASAGGAVFLPVNINLAGVPTVYYIAGTLSPKGVSIYGPPGGGGTNFYYAQVNLRGAPGKDVFATGDPASPGYAASSGGYVWKDFGIIVDDSEDVSSSNTHRKPGKTCSDVTVANGSPVVTSTQCAFNQGDVGQNVSVTNGTNTLTTTIVSVPVTSEFETNTATLAANWSFAGQSDATMYVAVMGQSLSQTIGNCALAYDDTATYSNANGPDQARFDNLSILSLSGNYQNNSCAFFFQGTSGQPYGVQWNRLFIRTQWGLVAALSDNLPATDAQIPFGDRNLWQDVQLDAQYPWVTYNGGLTRWEGGQIYAPSGFGPQILDFDGGENGAANWIINNVEFEGSGSGEGWRVDGVAHSVRGGNIAGSGLSPAQWDANASVCELCTTGSGNLNLTGSLNRFEFIQGTTPSNISDAGFRNRCSILNSSLPYDNEQPSIPQSCSAVNSRQANAFVHTADFVTNGDENTPYNNQSDLFIWPQDLYGSGVVLTPYIIADSTSETGVYLQVPSGGVNIAGLNGATQITVGQTNTGPNLPATKVHVCFRAKLLSGGPSIYFELFANGTNVGQISPNLSSSYATYCFDADLTSYSGDTAYFEINDSGTTAALAWISVHPWSNAENVNGAVNAANFEVSGAPLGTVNLADWTDSGVGNGSVPMWNAATSKWTPATLPTSVSSINGGSVPAGATVIGTNSSGQPVSEATTGSGSVVLASGPTMSGPTISGTTTMQGNITMQDGTNANQTLAIQPGSSADQIGAVQFNNYSGTAEWQVRKDANNYLRVTDAVNTLDRLILPANANTTINAGAGANAVVVNNTNGSGTAGFIVYEGGTNYSTAAFQVSGSGNTTATGYLQGKFMMGTGSMGVAAGAAAGSSPTIACTTNHTCDGISGSVTLTTGTGPTTGTLATLSFPNTHTNQANCMVTTLSATGIVTGNTWTESTTAITITANTALTASTAYTIKYWCGGY